MQIEDTLYLAFSVTVFHVQVEALIQGVTESKLRPRIFWQRNMKIVGRKTEAKNLSYNLHGQIIYT